MERVIFFDGVCALCNNTIKWIIPRDPDALFKFSALDSERAEKLKNKHPELRSIDSIVLLYGDEIYTKGAAIRKIVQDLSTTKILKKTLLLIPNVFLQKGYELVASQRYKIFGKYDSCPLPPPEWRSRFIS